MRLFLITLSTVLMTLCGCEKRPSNQAPDGALNPQADPESARTLNQTSSPATDSPLVNLVFENDSTNYYGIRFNGDDGPDMLPMLLYGGESTTNQYVDWKPRPVVKTIVLTDMHAGEEYSVNVSFAAVNEQILPHTKIHQIKIHVVGPDKIEATCE